jgi:hypothetical protein
MKYHLSVLARKMPSINEKRISPCRDIERFREYVRNRILMKNTIRFAEKVLEGGMFFTRQNYFVAKN